MNRLEAAIVTCKNIKNKKTNDAIEYLSENKGDAYLSDIIDFVFNPYIVSGISIAKINKDVPITDDVQDFDSFLKLLCFIKLNNTGSNYVLSTIKYNLQKVKSDESREFCKSVISKQLKIGLDAKGINKAYGHNFIPTFSIMLAETWQNNKDKISRIDNPFALTEKLDGQRCLIVKEYNSVRMYSRTGKVITGCNQILKDVSNLKGDFVLDGELLYEHEMQSSKERYIKTMEILRTKNIKSGLIFYAFDYLTPEEFKNKLCKILYTSRQKKLSETIDNTKFKSVKHLEKLYVGLDYEVIDTVYQSIKDSKKEGLMLNFCYGSYEFKRSKNLLKIKGMQEVDLKIASIECGNGRLSNTLGKILCNYKGNTIGVGSGFADVERTEIWGNKDSMIGRVIKVQYFEETEDAAGKKSLRFPVFMCFKLDDM